MCATVSRAFFSVKQALKYAKGMVDGPEPKAALAAGAPTSSRPPGGMTALHIAASHPNTAEESEALVAALLAAGADPDVADSEGLKPIHAAAAVGRVAVVETLLKVTSPDAVGTGGKEGDVAYTSLL